VIRIVTNRDGRIADVVETDSGLSLANYVEKLWVECLPEDGYVPNLIIAVPHNMIELDLEIDLSNVKLDIKDLIKYAYHKQVEHELAQKADTKEVTNERGSEGNKQC